MDSGVDAKIVILGAQGVGKTSFVVRYVRNTFQQGNASTIGASFLAKRVTLDDCAVRLQIWDTAGQERFRSMAPMYYRSATCGILCYDITSLASFKAMHSWLVELKKNLDNDIMIHIVGTKLDLVKADPSKREVPFETCVDYVSKWLGSNGNILDNNHDPNSGNDTISFEDFGGAEACHEISAKDNEGVQEVFEAITRKIIKRKRISDAYNNPRASTYNPQTTIYLHNDEHEPKKSKCC
ncbi:hypothetical protein NADFUDRAFT_50479 [Nadsonia fulvescens var. elongata DSM 6958]|uniref:Ras-domain-containing protein n=1 Tax=Nadsonia fulvescens var. elongata DSM 6958 TaxID=857566 RepID=A0A1E3PMA5_9ASCO|nr:hypothetical protein NADFUDRAFT_50479 [Nadsonia fulvescens var. elongata DSM 6958]